MVFTIFQIIITLFLIGAIVIQAQGSGLSTTFGGGGEMFRSKRSLEKLLVWVTTGLATLFAIISLILLIHK